MMFANRLQSGCNPFANHFANINPMNDQEKSPPFARLQGFSGGREEVHTILCLECGDPIRVTVRSTSDGQIAAVHNGGCFDRWRNGGAA
jgi:hypothetical protein